MNSVSSLNNYTGTSLNSLNGQTATYGSISDIPMENIDHIEYVTGGAATTVYGSDAANGVIQIFTKKALTTRFRSMRELISVLTWHQASFTTSSGPRSCSTKPACSRNTVSGLTEEPTSMATALGQA